MPGDSWYPEADDYWVDPAEVGQHPIRHGDLFASPDLPTLKTNKGQSWSGVVVLHPSCETGAKAGDKTEVLIRRELYFRYRWLVPLDSVYKLEQVRISADSNFVGPRPAWAPADQGLTSGHAPDENQNAAEAHGLGHLEVFPPIRRVRIRVIISPPTWSSTWSG